MNILCFRTDSLAQIILDCGHIFLFWRLSPDNHSFCANKNRAMTLMRDWVRRSKSRLLVLVKTALVMWIYVFWIRQIISTPVKPLISILSVLFLGSLHDLFTWCLPITMLENIENDNRWIRVINNISKACPKGAITPERYFDQLKDSQVKKQKL